ncbi:hypothetical protein [Streptomyces sp. AJS327]|uniref:deoxynucleotide monophosphate kinase family protein n=1 Tax=Streptomyces sp. AJS327 TaxID=2545265 RepID=UPI0015DF06B5|nr:hypothetical protein [Streptomyces sp. AJS327]
MTGDIPAICGEAHVKHVALMGKSRSGKDTVAQILVRHAAYTRLAFADRLKEAALRTNPILETLDSAFLAPGASHTIRLADYVEEVGWERAKDTCPEVRRFLQEYGQTVREMDPKFWVRPVTTAVMNGTVWNTPCVVTDVRYRNEVDALRELGAVIVRVERPGAGLTGEAARHSSETELDDVEPDARVLNTSTLEHLERAVCAGLLPQLNGESE